jgi:predicted naringenin-chalcone synthase
MTAYIHHIETLVPPHAYAQDELARAMERCTSDPVAARVTRHLFRCSGITRRYSCLPDFLPGAEPVLYRFGEDGRLVQPSTQTRNRVFARASGELSVEVARRALERCEGFDVSDITHVVTVSCTGFYCPGPDCEIVAALGLPGSTERYHVGFMGCYAAFPALRMAKQFCEARPDAVVLVVCLELCTLHLQIDGRTDCVLANTLFADGCAAAIVSAREPSPGRAALAMGPFLSALAPEGRGDMAWEIGDSGFNMVLSSYVPDIVGANVAQIVGGLLEQVDLATDEIDLWAVHPGGKAILDKVEKAMGLGPDRLQTSRAVLANYGNMSSVTVLFVLEQLLSENCDSASRVCAMAFGPGLTVETGFMTILPAGNLAGAVRNEADATLVRV